MCGFRNAAKLGAFGSIFIVLTGIRLSSELLCREETCTFASPLNAHFLTLVGPTTMELGREEIQTDLPRLGKCVSVD